MSATAKKRKPRPSIDHVARLVEQFYGRRDNELYVGGIAVSEIAETFATPLFVYDAGVMLKKLEQLRATYPERFELFYSIKANPNAEILKLFLARGCGLEVASGGELHQALAAGCSPDRLIFAGPGKTQDELRSALDASIREIHVESIEEARLLDSLSAGRAKPTNIALRINPATDAGGAMRMGGQASPFGIDEECLPDVLDQILQLQHVRVVGVHLFMGTQILDAETLLSQYHRAIEIALQVAHRINGPLESIDFGGGLGTPYFPHEQELDHSRLVDGLREVDVKLNAEPKLAAARAMVEPGRFLVAEAGIYLSRVLRVKPSRGKTYAVIDGGMHHHLAASGNLGQTIKRNFPVAVANKIAVPSTQEVQLVGPLCTPLDCLARNVVLPPIAADDLIAVFQSGAYARTSSPHGFLSHDTPPEVLVVDGQVRQIRRRGRADDWLRDQVSLS
ncbi:L-glutamyl-[BtrI acyl-carrier protein] decarboxylase [Stieleria neptunia]|uniref:L-glutamyl-[BtrI acyl-carrier protein] decarboxylase n=1 Tax=Stieleria neptunia TaxID=2527979 RepID=A0A518HT65_9BACT|nr:type III PLP-dependent enzyme [Stieleria neptunia]QDV44014.1 L-glutamyl-[BtrI acyl-carrier protein] decarboxylase [Stieleria neptunia]